MGKEFGMLLRTFRKRSIVGKRSVGKTYTQGDLATNLSVIAGLNYSTAAISNWELGKNGISPLDRFAILGLVRTLVFTKGIMEREDAKKLLRADNHANLTDREIDDIQPAWLKGKVVEAAVPLSENRTVDSSPIDSPELIGRSNTIDSLLAALSTPQNPTVCVLVGIAGSGKSAVVQDIARTVLNRHIFAKVHTISWSQTASAESVSDTDCVAAIAAAIAEQSAVDVPHVDQMAYVQAVLDAEPTLLIFDGGITAAIGQRLCTVLPNLSSKMRCLIVSRTNPNCGSAQLFRLHPLNRSSAARYLQRYATRLNFGAITDALSDQARDEIYQAVGGLPTAIKLVVRLLGIGYQVDDVLDCLIDLEETDNDVQAMQATYRDYFGRIPPNALLLLNTFLFTDSKGANHGTLLALSGLTRAQWRRSYRQLEQAGLILFDPKSDWYAIHNLTSHMLQSDSLNPLHQSPEFSKLTGRALDHWASELRKAADRFALIDAERHHWFRTINTVVKHPEILLTHSASVFELSQLLYRFIRRRGFWQEWLPKLSALVNVAPLSSESIRARSQLGVLLGLAHRLQEADVQFAQAHAEATRLNEPTSVGIALVHLARIAADEGKWDDAERFAQRAQKQFEQTPVSLGEASCINLFGQIAYGKGEWVSAETYFIKATQLVSADKRPRELVRACHNVGISRLRQNKADEALTAFQKAAEITFNFQDDIRLPVINRLLQAEAHLQLNNIKKAMSLVQSIELAQLEERTDAEMLGRVHFLYAELAAATHNLDDALNYIDSCELLWGSHHPQYLAKALLVKTRALRSRKNKKAARQACRTALSLVLGYRQHAEMRELEAHLQEELTALGVA